MLLLFLVAALGLQISISQAQGTAFTYQGRLDDSGTPANGTYDLRFLLYDAATGGSQQGTTISKSGVAISNGFFTVTLDFGASFPGAGRWLRIDVRTNGAAGFFTLSPRQQVTAAPYAITAGQVVTGGLAAGTYANAVTFNNNANSFSGSGAGLTSLNASSLSSGTVPDARLSGNVALLNRNQSFTGINLFPQIGIGVASPTTPLQVANSASGLSDSYTPSVWGDSAIGDGVFGSTSTPFGAGVYGYAGGTNAYGVYGLADANGGVGVYGYDGVGSGQTDEFTPSIWGDSGTGDGVFGSTSADTGYGVYGLASGTGGVGVYGSDGLGAGQTDSSTPSMWGDSASGDGVYGSSSAVTGRGVYGTSVGNGGIGVYGSSTSTNGAGVWAQGANSSSAALTIGAGGFRVAGAGVGTSTAAFIQTATAGNISGAYTYISNPLCNNHPNALLLITPNFNAGGGWDHPVGVYYDGTRHQWAIFNEDGVSMIVGPAFNVLVINP